MYQAIDSLPSIKLLHIRAALLNAKSSGFEVFQFLFSIPNSRNKIDSNYDFGSFVCIERCSYVCVCL